MEQELMLSIATDDELNELVAGRHAGAPTWWQARRGTLRLGPGLTGVLWCSAGRSSDAVRPLVLVAREEDQRRLFTRFAQLRSDLSPLTAWCHFAAPRAFEALDGPTRGADFADYEASWTGLVVAETLLLAERPISKLRLPACLATQSFAVARAHALWGRTSLQDTLDRFDAAQRLFRLGEARAVRLRAALEPVWTALTVAGLSGAPDDARLRPVVEGLRALKDARSKRAAEEAEQLGRTLEEALPEAQALRDMQTLSPEQRLKVFDLAVDAFGRLSPTDDARRRTCLAFMAGYIATVAAGGSPTLSLAEAQAQRAPEIVLWAYVLGGVGEHVVWTSSFDGLGRLVARELLRPFRVDEPPSCDIGLEEAQALVDNQLSDPFVHLRLKQLRVITVALLPGVNTAVVASDGSTEVQRTRTEAFSLRAPPEVQRVSRSETDLLALLAEALWPQIEKRVAGMINGEASSREPKSRGRQRSGSAQGGPLFKGGTRAFRS